MSSEWKKNLSTSKPPLDRRLFRCGEKFPRNGKSRDWIGSPDASRSGVCEDRFEMASPNSKTPL